ncbi:MAG: thiamine phosphate synthase, partial [Helicobacter sp.]|nr:thiamine phosphate synthase [Helicobacter sp.]
MQQLYAISDEILTPYSTIHSQLQTALRAGVSVFQLRDKTHTDNEI